MDKAILLNSAFRYGMKRGHTFAVLVMSVISIYGNPCDDIKLHIWGSMCCTNLEGNKEDDVESLRNSRLLIFGDTRHPINLSKSDIMNRLM